MRARTIGDWETAAPVSRPLRRIASAVFGPNNRSPFYLR